MTPGHARPLHRRDYLQSNQDHGTKVYRGTFAPPTMDPFGLSRAALELRATVDRRSWDLNWQLPLPDGSDALGWEVEITAHLELVQKA